MNASKIIVNNKKMPIININVNAVVAAKTIAVGKFEVSYTKICCSKEIIMQKYLLRLHSHWDAAVLLLV